ncbi:MAG: bifunctional (p)ppGpp synthetase/guanosine-3',5'-bis(diphosphate) 3'-pyrophosphohydrolase [Gammaproteobacteria bacterium]
MSDDQIDLVVRAYEFGAEAHAGQTRQSGEPYISHPVAVAGILADMRMDAKGIAAAILHDVIEDTPAAKEQLDREFGSDIAALVDGVTKLDQLQFRSRVEAQAESFRKMLLAMVEDIRVILVKLADRLHNMRTLDSLPREKQSRIARETLEIYAPIANRLGINTVKTELEDLGFRYLRPYRYRVLERALKKAQGNQRQIVRKISDTLEKELARHEIPARIVGRQKHLHSIYRKMLVKGRTLSEIVDVYGFRIIVEDVDDCYRALGLVHKVYKPMPGRFKDYVAIPRVNGYQSLHTTCFGPRGLPLEVQIRTREMDVVAETGIASHWRYKAEDKSAASPQLRAREWLRNLVELQQGDSSEEFLESVKVDLFPDKVYVFTPKGDIRRLPRGATAVDFAYAVHTDIGNRCVAAKIDRRLVPLRTPLSNGQTVEIITNKGARPNPNWVNFVVTAKARSAIRHYLKNLRRGEAAELGKRLLEQALKEQKASLRKVEKEAIQKVLEAFGLNNRIELYEQLGLGERLAPIVARLLLGMDAGDVEPADTRKSPALTITGTEGMVVTYARCCHPIPGDAIMGHLSSGRGVVIHRNVCHNLANFRKHPEKWVTVNWRSDIDQDFMAQLTLVAVNRMGVLAEVAATISAAKSNIEQVTVREGDEDSSVMTFLLRVHDRQHLAAVMRSIRKMPSVMKVTRDCA